MNYYMLPFALVLAGCTSSNAGFDHRRPTQPTHADQIVTAYGFYGYSENTHREELANFIGVDPVQTEWCAAFVNAVLRTEGIEGSDSVSEFPLTARSFLLWGEEVKNPKSGDIVVFPRGEPWQGHVGFYVRTVNLSNGPHYVILGGNQEDKVSLEYYPASRAISIRRRLPQPS